MNGLEIQNGELKMEDHSEIQLNNLSAGLYIGFKERDRNY